MSLGQSAAALKAKLEAMPGAAAAPLPSAPGVTVYKVMGKMFAILESRRVECVILKCDPHLADEPRQQYAGVGHRSHLDRRFWISVCLDADVPAEEIKRLAAHSYGQVCAKLTRRQQADLKAMSASRSVGDAGPGARRKLAKRRRYSAIVLWNGGGICLSQTRTIFPPWRTS